MLARPLSYVSRFNQSANLPLWLKLIVTVLYVVICRGTWKQYSTLNFLWFSHIGFMGTVVALWFENRLLASMMLLNSFVADGIGWSSDLLVALVSGHHPFGATEYMFDAAIPLTVRLLSLFHVAVPALLAWTVYKLRYDRRANCAANAARLDRSLHLCSPDGSGHEHQLRFWTGNKETGIYARVAVFRDAMLYVPLGFYLPVHLTIVRGLK